MQTVILKTSKMLVWSTRLCTAGLAQTTLTGLLGVEAGALADKQQPLAWMERLSAVLLSMSAADMSSTSELPSCSL